MDLTVIYQDNQHTLHIERDPASRVVTREAWYKGSKLDRADNPAVIERDPATGNITLEAWCRDGQLDRMDGPAVIERDAASGIATYTAWCKNGRLDRTDGPAVIERDAASGTITSKEWFRDGRDLIARRPMSTLRGYIVSERETNAAIKEIKAFVLKATEESERPANTTVPSLPDSLTPE